MSLENVMPLATGITVKALRMAADARIADLQLEGMTIYQAQAFQVQCGSLADWIERGSVALRDDDT